MPEYVTKEAVKQAMRSQPRGILFTEWELDRVPTVDAISVDEIRVDIMSLSLENQEVILNVSICGRPNEVKLPFSKEVVEVIHGQWEDMYDGRYADPRYRCSVCKKKALYHSKQDFLGNWESVQALTDYCPHCGAEMNGGINK